MSLAKTIYIEPGLVIATLSISSLIIALIITLVVKALIRGRIAKTEMYIGGESEDVLSVKSYLSSGWYWAYVSRTMRKVVEVLRDKVHTGILNDWYIYVAFYLTILLVISLILGTKAW